jgi:hypothetical protein
MVHTPEIKVATGGNLAAGMALANFSLLTLRGGNQPIVLGFWSQVYGRFSLVNLHRSSRPHFLIG